MATGDLDNDGDLDLLVTNNHGPARVLLNVVGSSKHWIGLRLQVEEGGRDALGARVELRSASGRSLWRRAHTDGSYGSASDSRVLFGLADEEAVQSVIVHWPRGRTEVWTDLETDRYWSLVEGGGDTVAIQ